MATLTSHNYMVGLFIFMVISLGSGYEYFSMEWLDNGEKGEKSNDTFKYYNTGVRVGIIDPEKYSLKSFKRHEKYFRNTLKTYNKLKGDDPLTYGEWLLLNNYGILRDTQMSILENKKKALSKRNNKKNFVKTVRKGDILLTNKKGTGLVGHVGMMATNKCAIEMPGGKGWASGIKDNNRRLSAGAWFDEYSSAYTMVYRCLGKGVANKAGDWAYHNYYNPKGGRKKTIHTTYRITPDFSKKNPSYCSKLVLQAFYFTERRVVIDHVIRYGPFIIPAKITSYFTPHCEMSYVGRF
ncbi:uncharacterized 30.3 kDa protein-like [Helicoverpa zea]|uniref:uncharacterized 30.3 kDa protein-like n=1 Tax=Helicoverpa zea TaxID=7113 RepID=UPI001F589782|nr:uncharacterized 30.3 kDa protein-like [Helicoverpa zea]